MSQLRDNWETTAAEPPIIGRVFADLFTLGVSSQPGSGRADGHRASVAADTTTARSNVRWLIVRPSAAYNAAYKRSVALRQNTFRWLSLS